MARYPLTDLYDSGFPMATKLALIRGLSYRPNLNVTLATQDVSQAQLTNAEEISVASVLYAALALHPESTLYGTPVCRAAIVSQSGRVVNSSYKGLVSMVRDLAVKRSLWGGAGNGNLRRVNAYDVSPANHINGYMDVNNTFKNENVKDSAWDNQLIYAQYYDRSTLFYPAYQSVYKNETSILNSEVITRIMSDLVLVCDRIWRQLTGDTERDQAQFIEDSNRLFNEMVDGRYADRVVLVPRTYFTEINDAQGFSWTMDVEVYGNNMKTVGTFNIIARRLEDLQQ